MTATAASLDGPDDSRGDQAPVALGGSGPSTCSSHTGSGGSAPSLRAKPVLNLTIQVRRMGASSLIREKVCSKVKSSNKPDYVIKGGSHENCHRCSPLGYFAGHDS